jgi:protein-S-isoprenylcysteine O-methyltransferase Ste14
MALYSQIILALWCVFLAYWMLMSFRAKKSVDKGRWWKGMPIRAGFIFLALMLMRLPTLRPALHGVQAYVWAAGLPLGLAGIFLCVLGMGFAVWARVHLGRNWGMPMSRKEDPELVTGGPYAYVRHPIYTGYLVAMLGSALGESVVWAAPLLVIGAFFVYSARNEEKLMLEQFPNQYPAYMKRTKMLVPWLV